AVVKLDDGTTAVVFRVNNDDLLNPRVKTLVDPAGRWVDEPQVMDLRIMDASTGTRMRTIVEAVPAAEAGVDDVWQYL
ncbi:MAG: hypothetical protein Q8K89_11320, partial [Actinomycetota bacterium]|nr:hypothetical protein [Actinomycetota bacterium]